jgi:hypothetical protein
MPQTSTRVFGGPFNGFSTVQTETGYRDTENVNIRNILKESWNGINSRRTITTATGTYNRVTTPFRAVNNSGDFLGRINYSCGGPSQINSRPNMHGLMRGTIPQRCDTTGIAPSTCNVRFVADSSDYTTFKKQLAINRNFNDLKDGGYTNSAYVNILAVRRY